MNRGDGAAYLTDELLFCFQLISLILFFFVCVCLCKGKNVKNVWSRGIQQKLCEKEEGNGLV